MLVTWFAWAGGHGGGGHGGGGRGGEGGGFGGHGGGMGHEESHESFSEDRGFGRLGRGGYPGWYGYGAGCGLGYGLGYGYAGYYDNYGPPTNVDSEDVPCPPNGFPDPNGLPPADPTQTPPPLQLTDADVLLRIRVDADATVWINDTLTTQKGPRREFISSGLKPGHTYPYDVRARWIAPDGTVIFRKKLVHVKGGERRFVDFAPPLHPMLGQPRPDSSPNEK